MTRTRSSASQEILMHPRGKDGTRVHDSVSFRSGKNSKLPVFRGKGSTIVVGRTPHPRRVASQTRWGGRRARKRDFLIHGFLTCVYHFLEDFKKEPKKRNPPGRFHDEMCWILSKRGSTASQVYFKCNSSSPQVHLKCMSSAC